MLGSGCWIALRAPVYILGFPDQETTWALSGLFKELEGSSGRILGNKARWRRVFGQEFGRELERHGERPFGLRPESISVENRKKPLVFGRPGGPDGKFGGQNDVVFCANPERGGKSDHNVEGALPLNVQFSRRVTSAAHRHDERVQYSKDDLNILEPPILPPSPKERPWSSRSGGATAVQGAGETSGRRLQEQHSETGKQAPENWDGEDWRSLSRALSTGQKFCSISNRDLMRIAELRFSVDMQEGDTGGQVALLQKALFWLGYLSKQSYITGHFGTETKQALCEFQEAHGVHSTGLWGPLSKQALWHTISGQILHRVVDENLSKPMEGFHYEGSTRSGATVQAWKNAISGSIPEGEWKVLSGIVLLVAGVFFGLIKLRSPMNESHKDHSVKRRIVLSSGHEDTTVPFQRDLSSKASSVLKEDCPMGTNGAIKASQHAHIKPASITELESAARLSPPYRRDIKVVGDPSSDLEVESGTQHSMVNPVIPYRLRRKATSAQPVASPKAISSKSVVESLRKDRQPALQARPAGGLGQPSAVSQADRTELLSSRNSSMQGVGLRDPPRNTAGKQFKKQDTNPSVRMRKVSQGTGAELNELEDDELTIKRRIEELRKAIEAAEQNGKAAMHALAEERQQSLELEVKISRQREAAAALEEEVRVLKESHDVLLTSLRKKLSSSSTTRGTTSLLYQTFDSNDDSNGES